jgi:hypothetical protein
MWEILLQESINNEKRPKRKECQRKKNPGLLPTNLGREVLEPLGRIQLCHHGSLTAS